MRNRIMDVIRCQLKRTFGVSNKLQQALAEGHKLRTSIVHRLEEDYTKAARDVALQQSKRINTNARL